jgi:hypothetical protein
MSWRPRFPSLPYVLLIAMTVACFGGPFLILVAVRGGESAVWPPDRAIEWITIGVVLGVFITLFLASVTIGYWCPVPPRSR